MIHVLQVPTPFAVGRVNCYLVEDDPLTLVDTGPNSGTSLTALESALGEHGRKVEDLERIVLTHQHLDHTGLAGILAARSGAEVVALPQLAESLASYRASAEADDEFASRLMRRYGVPDDVGTTLRAVSAAFRAWGDSAEVTTTVRDGETLAFADRTWHVLHRPGHSPTDTVFHDAERRELLGGDHLIAHISSNPLLARRPDAGPDEDRPRALVTYLESLRATREMDLDVVLPGHGEPVTNHRELIDDRFRGHEKRAAKIGRLIGERSMTAYEIAHRMWGNVALTQSFLTISEVVGHVDLLMDRGEVVEVEEGDVVRFARAG